MDVNYKDAYKDAKHQYNCYAEQVCGCWAIDAKDFCKTYGLDYERAVYCQNEVNNESYIEYESEVIAKITRYTGKLTQKQLDNVSQKVQDECYWEDVDASFWADIMAQILEKDKNADKEEDEE